MERNNTNLSDRVFDLLIVGGGIYGATLAWRASISGLSVALIEQNDFASGTSANSQKIIHGGLRYLQSFNFKRVIQSLNERRRMMWLAPHLVKPLPFVMPVYGHGLKGKETLFAGMKLYNMLSYSRNELPDEDKFIPDARIMDKREIQSVIPDLPQNHLLGAAFWHDAICSNTERLVISFLKSSVKYGAVIANYTKAISLIKENNKITGVEAFDKLSREFFNIKSKNTINCTGAWIREFSLSSTEVLPQSAGINLIVKSSLPLRYGTGIMDPASGRMYVSVPWKDKLIIGTEWFAAPDPHKFSVSESLINNLIEAFNRAYPAAELESDDVTFVHKGYVPAKSGNPAALLSEFSLVSAAEYGYSGYFSVTGVKYTTAITVAEQTLRKVFGSLNEIPLPRQPRLIGGEIENISSFTDGIIKRWSYLYPVSTLKKLISDYGSESERILQLAVKELSNNDHFFYRELLKAQITYAISSEMAMTLDDIVLRRTSIGSHEKPSSETLNFVADIASTHLAWTQKKKNEEIEKLEKIYMLDIPVKEWSFQ